MPIVPGGKKPKQEPPQPPSVITEDMAKEIAELAGIHPDDLGLLLHALYRLNPQAKVSLQRGGTVLRGRQERLPINDASVQAIERGEERREREAKLLANYKRLRIRQSPPPLERPEYPKPVGQADLGVTMETIRKRLAALDVKETPPADVTRVEIILKVVELLKRLEAARILHYVADRQREVLTSQQNEETKTETGRRYEILDEDELQRRARRTLEGFGKGGLNTLIDEASEVVHEDANAAAKVVAQWIGTTTPKTDGEGS
ncbi:MAG: hypothetical protein ACRC46_07060 [Thermoguttaceae bacterium]